MNAKTQHKTRLIFGVGNTAVFCGLLLLAASQGLSVAQPNLPEPAVLTLLVNGHPVKSVAHGVNTLSGQPAVVTFAWHSQTNTQHQADSLRFRFKLEGRDADWREPPGQARVIVSFLDQSGNEISKAQFFDTGQSPGWTGSFETSPLQHQRTTVVVPPEAHRFWVTITSAGAPETVGAIAISDLAVWTEDTTNGPAQNLLKLDWHTVEGIPDGWMIDGTRAKMAKVVRIGGAMRKRALAILDDDPAGHAQWNTIKTKSPEVMPGQNLVIEWDQMFSIGLAAPRQVDYQDLPPGRYRFFLNPLDLMGNPTEKQFLMEIEIPVPFWRSQWFWVAVGTLVITGVLLNFRYRSWRRLQAENLRLEHQHSLERERFRIAQDIHDDLGARVTQISLASAMAERNTSDPEASKAGFQRITEMSRELVTSLHDTIWVVNPENDNLEAVGNYLCQMFNQLLSQAGVSCRLEVPPLPSDVPITSHQRHNLTMAVKEATNNIIKHAGASEVKMDISLDDLKLNILIQDNGHGFNPESVKTGSGLGNLKRRLKDIGGSVEVESRQAGGTQVHIQMPIHRVIARKPENDDTNQA